VAKLHHLGSWKRWQKVNEERKKVGFKSWLTKKTNITNRFFGELSLENKKKVVALCDVDVKKIGTIYHQAYTNLRVPIIHFKDAKPPFVLCVALDRTNGEFEKNLMSLNLKEGEDYFHFN
jgi:hypothetical protein